MGGLTGSRPVSFDEVGMPPGLEELGSPMVDKSIQIVNHAEHYPAFVIRNTFIDTVVQRPLSLEGFFQPREIHSCPASRPTSMDDMDLPPVLKELLEAIDEDSPSLGTKVDERQQAPFTHDSPLSCGLPPPPMSWAPALTQSAVPPPPPPAFSPGRPILQLSLSQMLSEVDTIETSFLPSEGSAYHHTGGCKPCAFFHTKGCDNGAACSFCHLCGPDEKRRRNVEKKQKKRVFGLFGA